MKFNFKYSSIYTKLKCDLNCLEQWEGQVGNGHYFPNWASLSQWGINFIFTDKCGKFQDNNFPFCFGHRQV